MAFITITKPAVGDPIKKSLIDTVVDNLDDLDGRAGGTGGLVVNGDFESGSGSTVSGWTSVGTPTLITSTHASGTKSCQLDSGDTITSADFVPVSDGVLLTFSFLYKAASATDTLYAEVQYFDDAQSALSTRVVINDVATGHPTAGFGFAEATIKADASSKFLKIKIACNGGQMIVDQVNLTYDYGFGGNLVAGTYSLGTMGSGSTVGTTSSKIYEAISRISGTVNIKHCGRAGANDNVWFRVYVDGSPVGVERQTSSQNSSCWTETDISVGQNSTIEIWARTEFSSSPTAINDSMEMLVGGLGSIVTEGMYFD